MLNLSKSFSSSRDTGTHSSSTHSQKWHNRAKTLDSLSLSLMCVHYKMQFTGVMSCAPTRLQIVYKYYTFARAMRLEKILIHLNLTHCIRLERISFIWEIIWWKSFRVCTTFTRAHPLPILFPFNCGKIQINYFIFHKKIGGKKTYKRKVTKLLLPLCVIVAAHVNVQERKRKKE